MKNRIASLFLVFALLMSLCTFAVARDNRIIVQSGGAERFTDVPTTHWAYDYINKVVGSGLFNGMTATTFAPSNAMTRAQFVIVMSRMEGLNVERVETQTKFPDVASTYWAAGAIAWATEAGIVGGFGDGTFKPASPITRGQFAALIHRYIVSKRYVNLHVVDPEPAQFTDAASVSTAFTNDVEYARIHGLLTGYTDGTVRASNPITRAAIAAILARFLDLVTESGYTPLLDGPVIEDPGDTTEDPGDTTPGVEVPSSYDDIVLTVKNEKYGTTSVTATRNGKTVASDDLQPGDRVTVTHVPNSGYAVSIRIKDANGKTVVKHTTGNSTWFEAPKALPVTITVTYSKSGGGGGGGGGGSSSSIGGGGDVGPGGQVTPQPTPTTYYAKADASVKATAADNATHGKVFLLTTAPTATWTVPAPADANDKQTSATRTYNNTAASITGWVVFVPDTDYELDGAPQGSSSVATEAVTITSLAVTLSNGAKAFSFTATGNVQASMPTITITAGFKAKQTDQPPVTADEVTWTVRPQVVGGLVSVSENDFADTQERLTANSTPLPASFKVNKGEDKMIYVAVSPDTANNYAPGNPNLTRKDDNVSVPISTSAVQEKLNKTLYIYTISIASIQKDTETVLEGAFESDPVSTPAYDVNVLEAKYYNGSAIVTPSADMGLLNPFAEVSTAKANTDVTVYVPVTKGYQVREITVTGTSGATYPATLKAEGVDPLEYVFKMPNEAVTAQVVFEDVPDPTLTYTVKVDFDGEGTMTLNIGGEDVKFDGDGEKKFEMKTSEYIAQYGETSADKALPLYLGAAPIPASGYKYNESGSFTNASAIKSSTKENPYDGLTPGATLELKVVFVRERSFGYNLTVIGKGGVAVKFNGTTQDMFMNDTDGIKTTSHSEFIENVETVNVSVDEVSVDDDWVFDSSALINDEPKALEENYLMSEGMVDIVVAFRKKDAKPVAFTVTVDDANNNEVTLRAENGKFREGSMPPSEETAKNSLNSNLAQSAVTISESGTKAYYAYDGTIITLIPKTATGYKVKRILVNGNDNIADELSTKGFSYTLKRDSANALQITFDKFEQYRALLQAPYSATGALSIYDVHSSTQKIDGDQTLEQILYTFNNGQKSGKDTYTPDLNAEGSRNSNNIASSFGNMNKIVGVYLNTSKADGTTPVQNLEQMLEDSVAATLTANLSSMVEAQKNEMVKPTNANGQESDLQKQIKTAINDALSAKATSIQPVTVTLDDDTKSTIVKQVLDSANAKFREAYDKGEITFEDFQVSATVTPLLLASDETGIDKAAGKSVETQLQSFITDYLLNYLAIKTPGNVSADLEVKAEGSTVITVSAKALFDSNNLPSLDTQSSFNAYVKPSGGNSKLVTWLKTVASVTLNSSDQTLNAEFNSTAQQQTDVFSLAKLNANNVDVSAVDDALNKVDSSIASVWNEKWNTSNPNSLVKSENGKAALKVDMSQVLTKEMLDTVVEGDANDPNNNGILGSVLEELTSRVNSLGGADKATATKAAFLNIYRDFVVFDPNNTDRLITLKDKGDNPQDYKVLGKVTEDGDLQLTVDFNAFFRDVEELTDKTSFEKLIDLATALRDGLSTDIRNNSSDSAQTVLASLIRGQISKNGRLIATKWGATISSDGSVGRKMTDVEKKELADLTAELLMQPLNTTKMDATSENNVVKDGAWTHFEEKGYRSVSLSVSLARLPDEMVTALKEFDPQGNSEFLKLINSNQNIRAGFKVEQKLQSDS